MLTYPHIDPIIFRIGPLAVRWYGLMYLLGFLAAYVLIRFLARYRQLDVTSDQVADLLFYCVLGVIAGGRLGYVLFYDPVFYFNHPWQILAVWQGGMSFHGGLLGVVVAVLWWCRHTGNRILLTGDILVTASSVGLGLGRIGNFINGELWGRTTQLPWGMVFPGAGPLPRHPSQLYEAVLEGVVLFGILWLLHLRRAAIGVPFFAFLACYGCFRFLIELVREPDAHIGLLWGTISMGQLLSAPMILVGIVGVWYCWRRAMQP
ncbi:prolipoprotein diacylglyceryl transferase [Syntrophotalea carbinolica DSM 2380]|uniref:Phosphatidylglycerol--prolipoprotein diacylglyceryl transferase n=1 Tax=Syntrophotalea carbinolica (strain DSM 2380 / NBRC 103641 / GraBd1) TaxID=338963 RepID=Q3A3D9_SYNC1|nr:prolipoprotein diacylglyceryl transferase [Syntrophotalea carbinolica]ABA89118.1 prolipoprotein diacylglyceryl transferase [Syntrophotalea carbinolica DSM 2380]